MLLTADILYNHLLKMTPAMSDADVRKAAAMLSDLKITKKEVAEHFRVSRTTLNASLARVN